MVFYKTKIYFLYLKIIFIYNILFLIILGTYTIIFKISNYVIKFSF